MKKLSPLAALFVLIFVTSVLFAAGLAWNDHAPPYDFFFGNHIDTHQQSKLVANDKLAGAFYIKFSGEFTADGTPIAHHANCNQMTDQCISGWSLHGLPIQATLLEHQPGEHPLWCIDPDDMPPFAGFSHFHWLGQPEHAGGLIAGATYDGYLLRLTALETFYFEHHGGFLVTPGVDTETHANIVTDCN